jgi:hypothetical protein
VSNSSWSQSFGLWPNSKNWEWRINEYLERPLDTGRHWGQTDRPKQGALATRVNELLTPDGSSWDDVALHDNLLAMDAQAIKRIPLGRHQGDFWAWAGDCHRLYTVISAYRLLVKNEAHERDHKEGRTSSSTASNDPYWQKLWKCKVPPKIRVF